ncbi:MAG: DUF1648 domain-containing protein [Saprospiraceae bacterium]
MEPRPIIKLELSTSDKILEFAGWLTILLVWVLTFANYKILPDQIPTHFNAAGVADGYGAKWMIFTLPLVSTVVFVGLTILNKYPHIFNYLTTITESNAQREYTNATKLIRGLKFAIAFVFGLIAYQTIQHATRQTQELGVWFFPLVVGLVFVPVILYFTQSIHNSRSKEK